MAALRVSLSARRQLPAGDPDVVLGIPVEGAAESLGVALVAGRPEDSNGRQHRPQSQIGARRKDDLRLES